MREWGRQLRSWPVERPQAAERDSLPKWVDPVARQRDVRGEMLMALPVGLGVCVLPMLLVVAAMRFLGFPDAGAPAFALVGAGFVGMIAMASVVTRYGEAWSSRRQTRRTLDRLEARGESMLGAEVVGVTYADGRWRVDLVGDAWDWGALRFDFDRLVFVGEHSRFELRPADVVGTEIRRFDPGLGGPRPRLYLRYRREGRVESIGIDLPFASSVRKRVGQIVEFQERIERWRSELLPLPNARPSLLPSAEDVVSPTPSRFHQIGLPAKLLSGIATFVIVLGGWVSLRLAAEAAFGRGHRFGGFLAGGIPLTGMVLWAFLAYKIETRLPMRWRYREELSRLSDAEPSCLQPPEDEVRLKA